MAALASITAVRPTSTTRTKRGVAGTTIAAGQSVYLDTSDTTWKLADANGGSLLIAGSAGLGVAMGPSVAAGYLDIAYSGSIVLVGTTAVVGQTYMVGQTAGSFVPASDLTTSDYTSRLGTAETATQILLSIEATGIVHA